MRAQPCLALLVWAARLCTSWTWVTVVAARPRLTGYPGMDTALYAGESMFGSAGGRSFVDDMLGRFGTPGSKKPQVEETEEDKLLAFMSPAAQPWRAEKIKNLKIVYRPPKDSWKERFDDPANDTIILYGVPSFKPLQDRTRVDDLWNWPWMWTKTKADRLSWLHKLFYADCELMTVQEHIEMDCLLSEFDMPVRWGLLRMKELDVLNVFFLNLAFFTDFTGVKPTDLGLRPDGSVKMCAVQFHNCISSSNRPGDTDHYAPPFRWSRDKSPDQAYDEIKSIYMNYPKRGLKWSSGWIDRGGWHPQQFSGPYFYAQAESLAFHYVDDIELVLDEENREVQYRSSTRLGAVDWDVQRLRYNQIGRMLNKFGGWYTEPMPRLNWLARTPFHWTELLLDKTFRVATTGLDAVVGTFSGDAAGGNPSGTQGSALRTWRQVSLYVTPYLEQAVKVAERTGSEIVLDPRIAAALHTLDEWRTQIDAGVEIAEERAKEYTERVMKLLPEGFFRDSPAIRPDQGEAQMGATQKAEDMADMGGAESETIAVPAPPQVSSPNAPTPPTPDPAVTASPVNGAMDLDADAAVAPWRNSNMQKTSDFASPSGSVPNPVEAMLLQSDEEKPAIFRRKSRSVNAPREVLNEKDVVLKYEQLEALKRAVRKTP